MPTVLRGTVQSGEGLLAERMRVHADAWTRLVGTTLYAGSLNVLLDHPWTLPTERLRLDPAELGLAVNLVPCRIFGGAAFVFRTDHHESWVEQHRLIELLAAIGLRDAYALADGNRVAIELPAHLP
jgi:CTP-dependent riboflavin kinase